MRAKYSVFALLPLISASLVVVPGCATLKRLPPPGLVKYEDRAKGKPVNPLIATRIKEERAQGHARFPDLAAQPQKQPTAPPESARLAGIADLKARGGALDAEVATDRAAAGAESNAAPEDVANLQARAADLRAKIDEDRLAAAADKAQN